MINNEIETIQYRKIGYNHKSNKSEISLLDQKQILIIEKIPKEILKDEKRYETN